MITRNIIWISQPPIPRWNPNGAWSTTSLPCTASRSTPSTPGPSTTSATDWRTTKACSTHISGPMPSIERVPGSAIPNVDKFKLAPSPMSILMIIDFVWIRPKLWLRVMKESKSKWILVSLAFWHWYHFFSNKLTFWVLPLRVLKVVDAKNLTLVSYKSDEKQGFIKKVSAYEEIYHMTGEIWKAFLTNCVSNIPTNLRKSLREVKTLILCQI